MELGDARRTLRLIKAVETLSAQPTGRISLACGGWAETKAASRLLENPALDRRELPGVHTERASERMQDHSVVLCIQYTTELYFNNRPGIVGLGRLSYKARRDGTCIRPWR